ncbi:MAG: molybdopterin synthase subunit MoaD [Rhodocyclaceae bacterium]|nr:molybdopterin synthase subunit MoaD [Rhodocyclaceae bacterium]
MIESPVVSIRIPALMRVYAKGAEEVTVSGDTVAEALEALGHEDPALLERLMEPEGGLRPYIHIYLRGINILTLGGLDTALSSEDVLTVISMNIEEMAELAASANSARDVGKAAGRAL